jgi:hypothetical protein
MSKQTPMTPHQPLLMDVNPIHGTTIQTGAADTVWNPWPTSSVDQTVDDMAVGGPAANMCPCDVCQLAASIPMGQYKACNACFPSATRKHAPHPLGGPKP